MIHRHCVVIAQDAYVGAEAWKGRAPPSTVGGGSAVLVWNSGRRQDCHPRDRPRPPRRNECSLNPRAITSREPEIVALGGESLDDPALANHAVAAAVEHAFQLGLQRLQRFDAPAHLDQALGGDGVDTSAGAVRLVL